MKTTFWSLLKKYKITIPIVQRDYAQGRADQVTVRKRILKSLLNALINNKPVLLDYVYGNQENETITPLDGQQRLTTLWLLHWYLAMRLNLIHPVESEEVKNTLLRFSYETRVSSSDFCEALCYETISSVNEIEKQKWFYSNYKNEPTISAMLRMLKGTGNADGIDEVLNDADEATLNSYWKLLTREYSNAEQPPIAFYYFPLEEYKLTDDLYIKMNARGKALTDFENFKADFLDLVKKRYKEDNSSTLAEDDLEIKASSRKVKFASKMDNAWTDIFWNYRTENDVIDDIYLAFINRFFLNYLIVSDNASAEAWEKRLQAEAENSLGKNLYRNELAFDDFELYEKEIDGLKIEALETCLDSISKNIDSLVDIQKYCNPQWEDVNRNPIKDKGDLIPQFYFIPKYYEVKENERPIYKVNEITLQERIAFYAVCVYLEQDAFEKESFKDWMRIVWNFIENVSSHYSVSVYVNELRQIDKLREHSHDIVPFLSKIEYDNQVFVFDSIKEQVKEEIVKAKKIQTDPDTWKAKILAAENELFFRGAIRFLYRDEGGKKEWGDFDNKLKQAKKYFTKDGEAEGNKDLLRKFISLFDDWENHLMEIYFDNQKDTWRANLLNAKLQEPVAKLLKGGSFDDKTYSSNLGDSCRCYIQESLVKTKMLNLLVEGCRLHYRSDWCGGVWALHPYNAKAEWKIYFLHVRNEILCSSDEISFSDESMNLSRENKICWGKNIRFKYNGREFMWTNENKIHLMLEDGSGINKDVCFPGCNPYEKMTWDDFKQKLDGLM